MTLFILHASLLPCLHLLTISNGIDKITFSPSVRSSSDFFFSLFFYSLYHRQILTKRHSSSPLIWKKVEEYLRLFESYGGNRFSLFLMSGLGKLVLFSGRMGLRMKFIAKKELIFLFQMAPSRILWDQ